MSELITFDNWEQQLSDNVQANMRDHNDVLAWAFDEYREDIVYACSFGAEGVVLIDLISGIKPDAKVVFLDTGLHFEETYTLIDKVRERYPQLDLEMATPKLTVEEQADEYGDKLWQRDPNLCCAMRKTEPLKRALKGKKAWISGLRREQSPTRKNTPFIHIDKKFQLVKICPLIYWSWDDILEYIDENEIPYNELHDNGYPSIGCAPCTQPAKNPEDMRSGRWSGFTKTECGLHQ